MPRASRYRWETHPMGDPGGLRNLEQLQEDDDAPRMPRGVTPALVILRGACVGFARVALAAPPPSNDAAPAGHEGGYQLQVSSFHTQGEAQGFADQLRARGHKAYVLEAHVPGRGTWYRVRVGPFATQHVAMQYRTAFEEREHVVPFVVSPDKPHVPAPSP